MGLFKSQAERELDAIILKLQSNILNNYKDAAQENFKAFEEGTVKLDREDWEKSLDMWYEAMGWDKETGIPTRATLEKFDLGDCADKLEELGLI